MLLPKERVKGRYLWVLCDALCLQAGRERWEQHVLHRLLCSQSLGQEKYQPTGIIWNGGIAGETLHWHCWGG